MHRTIRTAALLFFTIAARRLGRETVQYVSNIYKYYIAYRSIIRDLKLKKEKKIRAN